MRRAFMCIFPSETTAIGAGISDQSKLKTADQQQQQKPAANMKTEVSVFSSYDKSQDGTVDFKEANEGGSKGTSLFDRVKKENYTQLADNATHGLSKEAKANVLASAQKKSGIDIAENLQTKFESLLESKFGKVSGLTQKFTAVDGKIGDKSTNEVSKEAQSKFDAQVKTAAQNAMASANQELMTKFMDALSEATANQRKEDTEKAGNDKNKNGNYEKGASLEVNADDIQKEDLDGVNAKAKETVYSSYDKDKNENVTSSQDEIGKRMTSGFKNNVKIMGGNDEQQAAVMEKLGFKGNDIGTVAQKTFAQAISNFSENVGSKTFKKGGSKEELAAAMNKLNQAAEKAADKAAQKASDSVNKGLQKDVNAALADILNPKVKTEAPKGKETQAMSQKKASPQAPNPNAPEVGTRYVPGGGKEITVDNKDGTFTRTITDNQGGKTVEQLDSQGNTMSTSATKSSTNHDGSTTTTTTNITYGKGDDGKTKATGKEETKVTTTKDKGTVTTETEVNSEKSVKINHKVKKGDTCWGLARTFTQKHEGFEVSAQDIMDQNNIKDPKKLQVGQELKIKMKKKK